MEFRTHTTRDYGEIAELRWLLKTIEEEGDTPLDPELHAPFVEAYVRQLGEADAAGDTVHWVAEKDTRIVGVLTIRMVRKELSPGHEAGHWGYLTNVFMREDHRDGGHGSQMLKHAIEWARGKGLELLIVWPSERSYPFYRRAGFAGREDPLTLDLE